MNLQDKTTKEQFKWLLDNFEHDDFKTYNDIGICEKVDTMELNDYISINQKIEMKDIINQYQGIAILNFGAIESSSYWWAPDESDARKKFIKHIIKNLS